MATRARWQGMGAVSLRGWAGVAALGLGVAAGAAGCSDDATSGGQAPIDVAGLTLETAVAPTAITLGETAEVTCTVSGSAGEVLVIWPNLLKKSSCGPKITEGRTMEAVGKAFWTAVSPPALLRAYLAFDPASAPSALI